MTNTSATVQFLGDWRQAQSGAIERGGRCNAWDSRFGDNYWFEAGGAPPQIPTRPVSYRGGALTRPEMVNVENNRVKSFILHNRA